MYHLGVDIGASSGRHIIGWIENGVMKYEEVYRFYNGLDDVDGTLCWNTERLFSEIKAGMKKCAEIGKFFPIKMMRSAPGPSPAQRQKLFS